tara:strand:- start:631 stop:1563 length:933 start_codon:yes stop_codon:yes gene_type:complete
MEVSILIATFVLSAFLHYGIQKLFVFYRRFDDFNHRSSHKTLATRTGGIGIFLTVLVISLFNYFQGTEIFDYSLFIPLGIMFLIGVYDDLYNADFKLKFFLQIIVAKILIDQGYVISNYYGLFGLYEIPWFLAQASTIFVFIVVVNAINFIDGIDGLAITEAIKIILVIEYFSHGLTPISPLGLLAIASILPLYYFNFKRKRKVFLGDGGSLLIGTLICIYTFSLLSEDFIFSSQLEINKTFLAIVNLIYPLFDLLRVFILRIVKGKSPFQPDQQHLHHLLTNKFKLNAYFTIITIIFLDLILLFFLTLN